MEAITTSPFLIVVAFWPTFTGYAAVPVLGEIYEGRMASNALLATFNEMRSWGRFGPAIDGTTVERSNSIC